MQFIDNLKRCARSCLNIIDVWKFNIKRNIEIGRHTKVRMAKIEEYVRIGNFDNVQCGDIKSYTYLGDYCELPQTSIGKFCSIAGHVILAAGNHPMSYVSTSPYTYDVMHGSFTNRKLYLDEFYYTDDEKRYLCKIGNDVWIGTGAILVCGSKALHIGNGAVIAAGAVVTKDVPPYAIVAGNPAKVLRYRFSNEVIEKLEKQKWWDKDQEWIKSHVNDFINVNMYLNENIATKKESRK